MQIKIPIFLLSINYENSKGKVKQMIDFFNKGEFDPSNRIHTDINYIKENKNKYKTKEKGIKIKIKMLEEQEKKDEEKEEKKDNQINIKNEELNKEEKEDNYNYGEYKDIESEGIEPLF